MILKTACGLNFRIDIKNLEKVSLYNWYSHKAGKKIYVRGYLKGNRKSGLVYLHHVILEKPKDGFEIDHIDGNGMNNCLDNLRIVTRSQNNLNRKNVKGYYFSKSHGAYISEVWKDDKKYYAGISKSEEGARHNYLKKVDELFGADAKGCL